MPLRLPLHFLRQALLVLVVMLGGCRSERVAFRFRPAPDAARPTAPLQLLPNSAGSSAAPVVAYATSAAVAPLTAARYSEPKTKALSRSARPRQAHRHLLTTTRALLPKPAAASRPRGAAVHETRHLLLGIAVVAVGVVAGLLLGGWLGLGVGALLVILGYYFLGMAFGGEHAWLEVFQEFFNM